MWRISRGPSALVLCAIVSFSGEASAFCRTTTCDPETQGCSFDEHGCNEVGVPLYWLDGAMQLKVASAGSALRDISADEFEAAASGAIDAWQNATCEDGKKPSLKIAPVMLVEDPAIEFVEDGVNENVAAFRDDGWPHQRNAVAKTNLGFYVRSGELIDTDIELNSTGFQFATSAARGDTDLQAVLTHEIGHALGLDHSDVEGSTMMRETTGSSTEALRSLEPDDMKAICTVYPPLEPPVDEGGCTVARAPGRGSSGAGALVVAALGWLQMSRSRHRRATR